MARNKGGFITVDGIKGANLELYALLKKVTTDNNRDSIIDKAIPIAIAAYRSFVPVSNHYIKSGNLRRSVKDLRKVLPNFDWKNGTVGTHKTDMLGELNSEERYNGYYAHMVYGNAKAWYRKVVLKAAAISRSRVIGIMAQEAKTILANTPKKFWQN